VTLVSIFLQQHLIYPYIHITKKYFFSNKQLTNPFHHVIIGCSSKLS